MNNITQLRIQGMHCAACVVTIERALSKVDGVQKAVVNLAHETARVEGDVLPETLINAVTSTGYEATLMDDISLSDKKARGTSKWDLKGLSHLFMVLVYITMAALLMNRIEFIVADLMYDFMGLFYIVFSFFKSSSSYAPTPTENTNNRIGRKRFIPSLYSYRNTVKRN